MDELTAQLRWWTDRIQIARLGLQAGRAMGKMTELGDRIKRLKERHEREAEELGAKVARLESETDPAFARGHNIVDSAQQDLEKMVEDLAGFSNGLPTEDSAR